MNLDADRHAGLLAAKLGALVRERWGVSAIKPSAFPGGAAASVSGRAWVLLEGDATRRLGAALAWAAKAGAEEVHVLVDDAAAAGVLARRASAFARPPVVHQIRGRTLAVAAPAAPPELAVPAPQAELYRPVLSDAGLDVIVEHGQLIGELRGLEVARVVLTFDGSARVDAGVGRFDQEASSMMFADLSETDAVIRAASIVGGYRRPGASRHPLNQLVPERWLRWLVVQQPELVGAKVLAPVESVLARRNLNERSVATALGIDLDGNPVVVTCSTGVDLELVPAAADDRLAHAPDARLVLAVPSRDALPTTTALAGQLLAPAEVVTVDNDWKSASPTLARSQRERS
ncbi:MAG: hypothetical protein M3Z46_02630 [Actinomycetota bacterium]|nr:hypothetical protein [Actinomycetota bacterium]